jgi:prefoldin subunit 5
VDREGARALRKLREHVSEIESSIKTTEGEIEAIDWKSADPEIARDGEQMRGLQHARSDHRQSLDNLYREWEQVSSEIEAAENALETEAFG